MVKEMFYDLEFTEHGYHGISADGVYFITQNNSESVTMKQLYEKAIWLGLHVRFENQKVRDELTGLRAV